MLVDEVLARREVAVTEYQVKLGASSKAGGGTTLWLPASQLHKQLVVDYERAHAGEKPGSAAAAAAAHHEHATREVLSKLRQVLVFMEPPAWTLTSQSVAALSDSQLISFPLVFCSGQY